MKKTLFMALVALSLTACNKPPPSIGGKFATIKGCLLILQEHSKSKINMIAIDTPTKVTGILSNGAPFGCVFRSTGTEGNYVEGWYSPKTV